MNTVAVKNKLLGYGKLFLGVLAVMVVVTAMTIALSTYYTGLPNGYFQHLFGMTDNQYFILNLVFYPALFLGVPLFFRLAFKTGDSDDKSGSRREIYLAFLANGKTPLEAKAMSELLS